MNYFERFIKKNLQAAGILIKYYSVSSSEEARRVKLIKDHDIDLIFDVGANKGQYALSLIDAGYENKIVSFEPLTSAHKTILNQSNKYKNWTVEERCALGNENIEIEINISANLVSSTLLNMLDAHVKGAPESGIIGKEKVNLLKLEDVGKKYISSNNVYVKIDVQGFEYEVLKGSAGVFKNIRGIELEMSVEPLYDGQTWLFDEALQYMKDNAFLLHSIVPAFTDINTGKVLQYNGIFYRK